MKLKRAILATLALWDGLAAAGGARAVGRPATVPAWVSVPRAGAPLAENELAFTWLGTAGFAIRTAHGSLLIDPHYSRHGLGALLSGPLRPDQARIRAHLTPADAVFVGHAHHDHLIDAPTVAGLLKAPFYGSADAARVARASGLPAGQVHALQPADRVQVGDLEVEAVASKHSDMITNWLVSGSISPLVHLPMRFWDYKHGAVLAYAIHWRGRTLYHFGSAELVEASLVGRPAADVVLLCLSGWKDNASVFKRLNAVLAPRVLVPMHHDDFFRPLAAGFHEGPLAFVAEARTRIARDMPRTAVLDEDFFREYRITAREAP